MALYGWRLIGVTCTVLVYIAGVLFLSVTNVPGPHHPKKIRIGRFGELSNSRNHELIGLSRRQTIQWCKDLQFLGGEPNFDKSLKGTHRVRKTFNKKELDNSGILVSTQKSERELFTQNSRQIGDKFINNNNSNISSNVDGTSALASFPGSGNTWLRYLLQQSTGIFTGSIYKDYGLLKSGFPAENISNKSVLVVKTHEWGPKAWAPFDKAVLLIRDPDKAILAEFNRQSGGHIGFASPDRYKRTKGRYWQQFVTNKLAGWESMNLAWAKNFTGSLKIVYYDDLVEDVENVLRDILIFLNFPVDESLLMCAMMRKEGIFRRRKRILSFDPYTPTMRKQIEEKKIKLYATLRRCSSTWPICD